MSTKLPGRLARLLGGLVLFGVAATEMLDELARLTAAPAPLRVTA
ncbi:hypothetical protein [Micromonospora sp. NPDC023633]